MREVDTADDSYSWDEYLLFNPYKGFRYLTEYNGHWNFVQVQTALPEQIQARGQASDAIRRHDVPCLRLHDSQHRLCVGRISLEGPRGRVGGVPGFRRAALHAVFGSHTRRSHLVARRIHDGPASLAGIQAPRIAASASTAYLRISRRLTDRLSHRRGDLAVVERWRWQRWFSCSCFFLRAASPSAITMFTRRE